jgi:molecular chaperone GrpE
MSKKRKHNKMKDENKPITEEQVADNELNEQVDEQSVPTDTELPESEQTTPSADDKIAELTERCAELADKNLRMMAEFDNFRKRTQKEKDSMFEIGAKSVIEKILPVVDSFERGLAGTDESSDDGFVTGMHKIYKQLMQTLEEMEVTPIDAVGKEFDPDYHNAVLHVDDEEAGDNIVVEELQKGYLYRGNVVRHSMVKVAN